MALVQGAIGREWAEKQQGWERGVDDTGETKKHE